MKKKLFMLGAGVFLSASTMAGNLTLSAANMPANITEVAVACGPSPTSERTSSTVPIMINSTTHSGSTMPLPYGLVYYISTPLFCDFYENSTSGQDIGSAHLLITSPSSTTATIVSYTNNDPSGYVVTVNGAPITSIIGQPETNLSVLLTHN